MLGNSIAEGFTRMTADEEPARDITQKTRKKNSARLIFQHIKYSKNEEKRRKTKKKDIKKKRRVIPRTDAGKCCCKKIKADGYRERTGERQNIEIRRLKDKED